MSMNAVVTMEDVRRCAITLLAVFSVPVGVDLRLKQTEECAEVTTICLLCYSYTKAFHHQNPLDLDCFVAFQNNYNHTIHN